MLEELWDQALWARVGMALLCGGIVGLERQLRGASQRQRRATLVSRCATVRAR